MAIPNFWRINEWCKASNGYAMANAQVFFLAQPANTSAFPPTPQVQLYSDPFGLTPIPQPLVADGYGFVYAYVAAGTYTMVVALSNVIQNVYADQSYGLSGASTAQISLQTNGIPNANQGLLNLVGAGDITVNTNALGQTVVESTGTVIPGTGTGSYVVTAFSGVVSAPNNDILTADGSGNAKDSGVLVSSLAPKVNAALTGTTTIALANITSMNSVLNAADFPGSDIGAQVNNAIASTSPYAATVFIPAGSYNFSTQINLPMGWTLQGACAKGTSLTWTPTTGCAIACGSSGGVGGAINDIVLNGSGGTATGIYYGGDPTGTINSSAFTYAFSMTKSVAIQGFKYGIRLGNNCWATTWLDCYLALNSFAAVQTDASVSNAGENQHFIGCSIVSNSLYAFYVASESFVGTAWKLTNCSIDYNGASSGSAPAAAVMQGGFVSVNCHFENGISTTPPFFDTANGGCVIDHGSYFVLPGGNGNAFGNLGSSQPSLFSGSNFYALGTIVQLVTGAGPYTLLGPVIGQGAFTAPGNSFATSIAGVAGQGSAGALGVPVVVYSHVTTGQSSTSGSIGTYATTSAGAFRVSASVYATTNSSSAWTIYPLASATQNGATAATSGPVGFSVNVDGNAATATGFSPSLVFNLATSTTITFETILVSGSNTGGVYAVLFTVERLA